MAERNSRAHNKSKYGEIYRTLEQKYNKSGGNKKETEDPS